MTPHPQYTLYAAEKHVGERWTGSTGQRYHSFLALVEESPNTPPRIIDEINFLAAHDEKSDEEHLITHDIPNWRDEQNFETDYISQKITSGSKDEMQALWQKAQHVAKLVEGLKTPL